MPIAPAFQRHLDACFQQAPVWFESILRQVRETARQTRDPHVSAASPVAVAELNEVMDKQRADLARHFMEALKERVMESVDPPKPAARRSGGDFTISIGELHLVDEDQAAEEIEVIRVVQRADDAAEWELRELQARCATLRGEASISRDSNPWRPDTVARSMWDAARAVNLSSPARTLMMRLAAGPLARELREACIRMVKALDEQHVEPAAYKALPVGGERRIAEPDRAGFDVTQPGKFEELMRVAVPQAGGAVARMPMSGESLERLEALLQRVLATVPPASVRAGIAAQAQQAGEPTASPGVPNLIRQHQAQLQSAARHDGDRHVITMLAQLFDKILADAQINVPLRETLGRLQTPFLRCALNDPSFLDDHAHPSWLLLNRIASHAMGYEHPQDPRLLGFLDGIEPVLRELERSREQNAERHREVLRQVEGVITAQLRVEQEEIGPVIARRRREEEMAQIQARQRERIAQRIQAAHLPEDAVPPLLLRFLNGPWARVLASSTLLHGEDSSSVAGLTEVVDQLVRSVQPLRSSADRDWMLRTVPRVIERLRHGMALIDLPQGERDAFLSQLMAVHTDNLKAGIRRAAPAAAPSSSSTDELVRQLQAAEGEWSGSARTGDTVMDAASLDTVPADLMDITQRPAPVRVEDWLARLKPGAWTRVFVSSRLTPLRLLWVSPSRTNWVFSSGAWNRDGPPRVHALTRGALEQLHAQRLAADLEGPSLLERAADSLFQELQAGGAASGQAPAAFSEGLMRLNLG
ncbi:MAG: DUF1631 family protein [Aquabacterium sp.]|nr:MAG: DUF1631 family protein [Aquabacterium sp.]